VEMGWPDQLENGKLLDIAEESSFDILVTSDQNMWCQQNLAGRKLALVVLGSNIWPVVRMHGAAITASVDAAHREAMCLSKCRSRRNREERPRFER
jgi:hypothetical protein